MMEEVIDRIAQDNLESVRIKPEYISSRCPFHGIDRHPSFWIERSTGRWGCFSCSARGSNIRWLLKELGVKSSRIDSAIKEAEKDRNHTGAIAKLKRQTKAKAGFTGTNILPEALLGLWNNCPVALLDAGFKIEELERHDVGFDSKRKRITFPIRDIEGNLVGISGRTVTGAWPKYKVYQGYHDAVDNDGKIYRSPGELGAWFPNYSSTDIRNHLYRGNFVFDTLFNNKGDYLIVVEGYKACLWLVQMGYEYTVALMGAKMSVGQERIIRRMGVATYILLDNNDAGRTGSDFISRQLSRSSFPVYQCHYSRDASDSIQPDDLNKDDVENMLCSATRAVGNRRGSKDAYRSWRSKIRS